MCKAINQFFYFLTSKITPSWVKKPPHPEIYWQQPRPFNIGIMLAKVSPRVSPLDGFLLNKTAFIECRRALFCAEKNESMLYQYLAAKHAFDGNKQFFSSSMDKCLLLLLVFCWRNAFFKVLKNRYIHVMNHVVSTAFTFSIWEKMASGQMIKVGSPAVMSMSKTWIRSSQFDVR